MYIKSNDPLLISAPSVDNINSVIKQWLIFTGRALSTVSVEIGDTYGGGKVAYLLQPGDEGYSSVNIKGLIAAPYDRAKGITWNTGGKLDFIITERTIGSGAVNTANIVSVSGSGSYAAKVCVDFVIDSFSDWYLPSLYELDTLYNNMEKIGGFDKSLTYWSSSGENESLAVAKSFYTGDYENYPKSYSLAVRPIRSFFIAPFSDVDKTDFYAFMTTPSIDRESFLASLSQSKTLVSTNFAIQNYV